MSLDQAMHLVSYACVAAFVVVVLTRLISIARLPMHLRWELYPVAHEKGRAHYGGSYLEELDWWTKERKTSVVGEMKVMLPEILLLAGVRHKNKSMWARTFPFHLGLYLLIGATVLMLANGIVMAAGGSAPWLGTIAMVLGYAGAGLALLGALALLARRFFNIEYREFTVPGDYMNLLFFVVAIGIALIGQVATDADFTRMQGFFAGLVTLGSYEPAVGISGIQAVGVVLLSLLMAYIPATHMAHFFTKWFMYHDIRWSDEPLKRGGKIEAQVNESVKLKPTWAAPHIGADGKKNWVDIATSPGFPEEPEEDK